MRLFILTESDFIQSSDIIYQKVLDIIEVGAKSAHLHFYIVGNQVPLAHQDLFTTYGNVTILKMHQAEKLMGEVTNAIVIHFGSELKGSSQFPHYFIPLSAPYLHHNSSLITRWRQQMAFKKYIKKAVFTFGINDWAIDSLRNKYPSFKTKMQDAWLPVSLLPKLEWVDLSETRNELTQGHNYFLSFTPIDNLIATLKEFSLFKKWQLTTMVLVFILDNPKQLAEAQQILKGYKFQEDIVLKTLDQLEIEWLAAAYAVVMDGIDFDKTSLIEWAVHYDIPLLLNENNLQPASWLKAGDVFLFSEKNALFNHLKLYYKDEMYRQARAKLGKEWLVELTEQRNLNHFVKIPLDLKS
ncbi:MAG: hypothetical protein WCJ68_02820 [Chitinophagia bacterium]|jgi:hypothetical protein